MSNYFSEDITKTEVEVPSLVRSKESGDKIYLVKDGVKHWITSPEVLQALGADFGQETEIDKSVMAQLTVGEPIRRENVNNYILPVEEEKEEIEVPAQEVENSKMEGYATLIVPCVLTVDNVDKLSAFIGAIKVHFSGEIISVIKNEVAYKDYSDKFGHKVIECEDLVEGIERAARVARGTHILYAGEI